MKITGKNPFRSFCLRSLGQLENCGVIDLQPYYEPQQHILQVPTYLDRLLGRLIANIIDPQYPKNWMAY